MAPVAGFPVSSPPALFFAFSEAVANIFRVFSLRSFTVAKCCCLLSLVLSALDSSVLDEVSLFDNSAWSAFHFDSLSPGRFEPPGKQYARWRDNKFYQLWLD